MYIFLINNFNVIVQKKTIIQIFNPAAAYEKEQ